MILNDEHFKIPAWVADYRATLNVNSELAQAMLETGMPSFAAGQVQAGERVRMDDSIFNSTGDVVTF